MFFVMGMFLWRCVGFYGVAALRMVGMGGGWYGFRGFRDAVGGVGGEEQ